MKHLVEFIISFLDGRLL